MCFNWFAKARSQNIPISGPILKAKAMEIAGKLGVPNFNASDGWLSKRRIRNNVSFKCVSGEAADIKQDGVEQLRTKLPSLLTGYKPQDIYNADESGLLFRALPEKTLALKSAKCVGGTLSKERLTILFCANMAGDKELLLVIGKTARPRSFKHDPIAKLPVDWKCNKKAWMTREVMSEWLQQFNRRMKAQNRKIILFLDNAASHPKEAVYFIKASWDKVEATTVRNCFRKAGFLETYEDPPDFDSEDDIPLAIYTRLQERLDLANDLEGFLQMDQNVFTEDNNIEIQFDQEDDTMDISDSEDEFSEEISEPITSYDEVLKLVAGLK
ncbi:tigger transposable element-derived protein 6-like [Anastrepha ludens]|uniref:tigger transposable element-derived protein 6-like n=1 Tax=Anastrepha ludens TaxID=28586 RepID=UPI0023AF90E8|nr:tigger transposable element-derived protein 6-like [Anastrepha ludens]